MIKVQSPLFKGRHRSKSQVFISRAESEEVSFVPSWERDRLIGRTGLLKWLKRSSQFFFPTRLNALPRPGLEPRSSDSEPSALTPGLLDKAVGLTCPRYTWPRMLKVAPCPVVRSYGRTSKFVRLDGLLLFCIIMGLLKLRYDYPGIIIPWCPLQL